jgi:hypothetical protein
MRVQSVSILYQIPFGTRYVHRVSNVQSRLGWAAAALARAGRGVTPQASFGIH